MLAFLALALAAGPAPAQQPALPPGVTTTPAEARVSWADVDRFAEAYERLDGAPDTAATLDSLYLSRATPGLRTFARLYDLDAAALGEAIARRPGSYLRVATEVPAKVRDLEPALRRVLERYAEIYPDALSPPIWFLVGQGAAGGAVQREGVLLAVEVYTPAPGDSATARGHRIDDLIHLAAHELAHFQQAAFDVAGYQAGRSILARAIREGAADLLAEMVSGSHINAAAHAYGRAHEWALWSEFRCDLESTETGDWFFRVPEGSDRPQDLGYFLGYRIAESYYRSRAEDPAALTEIIRVRDWPGFLEASRYEALLEEREGRPFPACSPPSER